MKNPEDIEKFLRDQMRSIIPVTVSLAQWGVAVLLAFQGALFFVRRETKEALGLGPTELLPLHRYLIGTVILLVIAILFHTLSNWVGRRYRHHLKEFQNLPIRYPDFYKEKGDLYPFYPKDSPRVIIRVLFYFFPLLDILIYAYSWLWSVAATNREVFIVSLVTSAVTSLFTVPLGVYIVQRLKASSEIRPNGYQAGQKDGPS